MNKALIHESVKFLYERRRKEQFLLGNIRAKRRLLRIGQQALKQSEESVLANIESLSRRIQRELNTHGKDLQ